MTRPQLQMCFRPFGRGLHPHAKIFGSPGNLDLKARLNTPHLHKKLILIVSTNTISSTEIAERETQCHTFLENSLLESESFCDFFIRPAPLVKVNRN